MFLKREFQILNFIFRHIFIIIIKIIILIQSDSIIDNETLLSSLFRIVIAKYYCFNFHSFSYRYAKVSVSSSQ